MISHKWIYVCIYIYIETERERQRKRTVSFGGVVSRLPWFSSVGHWSWWERDGYLSEVLGFLGLMKQTKPSLDVPWTTTHQNGRHMVIEHKEDYWKTYLWNLMEDICLDLNGEHMFRTWTCMWLQSCTRIHFAEIWNLKWMMWTSEMCAQIHFVYVVCR